MIGELEKDNLKGIIPLTFEYLFNQIQNIINNDDSVNFRISFSYIRIYLEIIQDLFEPKNKVKIREDPEKGVYLENCSWIKVNNIKDFKNSFTKAEKNRKKEFN